MIVARHMPASSTGDCLVTTPRFLGGKAPNDEDLEARNHVAYELGNMRIWETDAYVGARANLRKEAAGTSR